jgi:hypothetical protein
VALGFASYDIMAARMYQSAERKRFDHARQEAATASGVASATTPPAVAPPVPTDGVSIGEIQIPSSAQGDDRPGRVGADSSTQAGHLPDFQALPGEVGNVVRRAIATHSFAR